MSDQLRGTVRRIEGYVVGVLQRHERPRRRSGDRPGLRRESAEKQGRHPHDVREHDRESHDEGALTSRPDQVRIASTHAVAST